MKIRNSKLTCWWFYTGILLMIFCSSSMAGEDLGNIGSFPKWQMIEISMDGPDSKSDGNPNPFAIVVDVTFSGPEGVKFEIPAFYNGDGEGGKDGKVWQVRFSGSKTGDWSFESKSSNNKLNGYKGTFKVTSIPGNAQGFYKTGRILYTGTAANKIRYFKLADGPYWIKSGADSPEGFLSFTSDWYYNNNNKRKEGIDYLSSKGINSLYMMVGMIGGDYPSKVWPWLEPVDANSGDEDDENFDDPNVRFHIPRLEEWLELFDYMQKKGVACYLIGQDDDSNSDYNHARFYRELIARFGWLPGIMFNDKEESGVKAEAIRFSEMDPYGIPTGSHNYNYPSQERSQGIVENEHFDMTSIQSGKSGHPFDNPGSCDNTQKKAPSGLCHNKVAIEWINACKSQNKRVLVVNFDEPRGGGGSGGRHMWWPAFLGGAGAFEYIETDIGKDGTTFQEFDEIWTTLGGAGKFMEHFDYVKMNPQNELITDGRAFCLAEPGKQYAVYVIDDEKPDFSINLQGGTKYEVSWWNPENGNNGNFQNSMEIDGGTQTLSLPSRDSKLGDWAIRIVAKGEGTGNVPPSASDGSIGVYPGESVEITLDYTDNDGPGPYQISLSEEPEHGNLSGSGNTRTYTANGNAQVNSTDKFTWQVSDGEDNSNIATVTINILNPDNEAPVVDDQSVAISQGEEESIPLLFNDSDSDGPFTINIIQAPDHGSFEPSSVGSNEYIYKPNSEFTGKDSVIWSVTDESGAESDQAVLHIEVGTTTNKFLQNLNTFPQPGELNILPGERQIKVVVNIPDSHKNQGFIRFTDATGKTVLKQSLPAGKKGLFTFWIEPAKFDLPNGIGMYSWYEGTNLIASGKIQLKNH